VAAGRLTRTVGPRVGGPCFREYNYDSNTLRISTRHLFRVISGYMHEVSVNILKLTVHDTKRLVYTALVRPILEYGAVCWDPYREGQPGKRFKSDAKERS